MRFPFSRYVYMNIQVTRTSCLVAWMRLGQAFRDDYLPEVSKVLFTRLTAQGRRHSITLAIYICAPEIRGTVLAGKVALSCVLITLATALK